MKIQSFSSQLLLFFLLSITTGLISSCKIRNINPSQSSSERTKPQSVSCREVSHDVGKTTICGIPERIVALDPHGMDLLLSLGVQPIGYAEVDTALVYPFSMGTKMTQIKYFGDRITEPPTYIGTRSQPSLEAIFALKPDLIVAEDTDSSSYSMLSQIAPTILLRGTKANQWQNNLKRLSKVFNSEEIAQNAIDTYRQKIQDARMKLAPIISQKQTLLLSTDGSSFTVFQDQEDYARSLLTDMGFSLITVDDSGFNLVGDDGYPNISLEVLPQLDADIIFVMTASDNTVEAERERWAKNPILSSLPAYENNQVYFVDYQLWSRIRGSISAELIIEQVQNLLLFGQLRE